MHADEKEVLLKEIFEDLSICTDYILTVLAEIKQNNISNYPIIVLSKMDIQLGVKVIDKKEIDIKWNFNISHLEEFVSKKIVLAEKAKEFIKVYKEHQDHFCLFVTLNEEEADFVYVNKKLI